MQLNTVVRDITNSHNVVLLVDESFIGIGQNFVKKMKKIGFSVQITASLYHHISLIQSGNSDTIFIYYIPKKLEKTNFEVIKQIRGLKWIITLVSPFGRAVSKDLNLNWIMVPEGENSESNSGQFINELSFMFVLDSIYSVLFKNDSEKNLLNIAQTNLIINNLK